MIEFLALSIIGASASAFTLIVLVKWRVIERLQLRSYRLGRFKDLAYCEFCLLFWLCFSFSLPLAAMSNIFYILLAPVATPIAKALYENCRAAKR